MNINELREQICGKEPVSQDYQYRPEDFIVDKLKWITKTEDFNATAAAILELVKERVPGGDTPPTSAFWVGYNTSTGEILTTIENLKNELK